MGRGAEVEQWKNPSHNPGKGIKCLFRGIVWESNFTYLLSMRLLRLPAGSAWSATRENRKRDELELLLQKHQVVASTNVPANGLEPGSAYLSASVPSDLIRQSVHSPLFTGQF